MRSCMDWLVQYMMPHTVYMWSHTTGTLWALWNANVPLDREPNFRLEDKQKQACFLNLCKECPFLIQCVWQRCADKTQPGGGTDVALTSIWASCPCSASHGPMLHAGHPTFPAPSQRGASPTKRRAGNFHSGESGLDAALVHVLDARQWPVIRRALRVHSRCFLLVSTLCALHDDLTRTLLWKTNTYDGNASTWCQLERTRTK